MESKILVHKAFTLTLGFLQSQRFELGEHVVSDEIANHPYVLKHATVIKEDAGDVANRVRRKR